MKEDVRAVKDAKEKPKQTKEYIKKNSNWYFVETLETWKPKAKMYALNFSVRGVLDTINKRLPTIVRVTCHPFY